MAVGTTLVGVGYLFLGHIDTFLQFVLIRLALVTVGDAATHWPGFAGSA